MVTSKVFVCLVCLCSLFIKQSEQCIVRESGDQDLPSFASYRDSGVERITLHRQAIIPSYEFTCCGNITEWGVDVQPGGGGDDGDYTLDLQVWRPSPTVDDSTGAGQYSLVGNNRFTSIPLDNDVAEVTPLSRNQVQFRPGDVLGFYVEEARNNDENRGVNVLTTTSHTSERVWYASVTTLNTMGSPVSVGSSGHLNTQLRGAPVISIAAETYNCLSDNQGKSGAVQGAVIAVIVVFVLIIVVVVSVLAAIIMAKKHREPYSVTPSSTGIRVGISNLLYEFAGRFRDGADNSPREERAVTDENKRLENYTAPYHSAGPNTTSSDKSSTLDDIEHTYEDDPFYHELEGAVTVVVDQQYKDPNVSSQVPPNYEMPDPVSFDNAGIYVPTEAERKGSKIHTRYRLENYNKLNFFSEEPVFWTPASTTSDLYSQLASKKYREIPRTQVNILEELGSGEFGQVCKAVWSISGATKELAVKTLRAELPEGEKVRFLQEAAIMGQFSHPNVVKLYGVVTVGEPVMICLELMENGDLRHYLCSIAPSKESAKQLKISFLRFSKQIACGMTYLTDKAFVHRDLAARNVLLDNTLDCKIGDFGLARDLVHETYYTPSTKGGKLPIKWMAPEALLYKKYSTDSDVWSYGMVLFEIWSVGKKPFSQFTNNEMVRQINTGYNQPPPPGCPRAIYQLMVDCWNPVHSKRPSFADIGRYLSTSVDLLLRWVEEDSSISPQVGVLGAPLSEADSLYKDLQNVYADTHVQ